MSVTTEETGGEGVINVPVVRDLAVGHVHRGAVALHVDVVEATQERFLLDVVDVGVVEHPQEIFHGEDGLAQGLNEHVLPLRRYTSFLLSVP